MRRLPAQRRQGSSGPSSRQALLPSVTVAGIGVGVGRRPGRGGNRADTGNRRRAGHRLQRWLAAWFARTAAAAVLAIGAAAAHAAPVEVPDPKAWAQLGADEQARRRADIQQRLETATPAERAEFRRQLRERLQGLSPQERQALIGQTREQWQKMTPEERERLAQQRRERLQAMSPAERRQLLQQRRLMLEKLSPEERAALREKLPER